MKLVYAIVRNDNEDDVVSLFKPEPLQCDQTVYHRWLLEKRKYHFDDRCRG